MLIVKNLNQRLCMNCSSYQIQIRPLRKMMLPSSIQVTSDISKIKGKLQQVRVWLHSNQIALHQQKQLRSYGSITSYKLGKHWSCFDLGTCSTNVAVRNLLLQQTLGDTFTLIKASLIYMVTCVYLLIECHHWLYHLITQHWIQCGDDKLEIFLTQWLHIHLPMMVTMVTTCIW